MYLHLGHSTVITHDEIIGIFDLDSATVSKRTRDYLAKAEKEKKVITVSYDLPKSFVVCRNKKGEDKIYLSQLSSSTLLKRSSGQL